MSKTVFALLLIFRKDITLSDENKIENPVELLNAIIGMKKGGEVREQQVTAVSKIDEAIKGDKNLIIEAPTGSGKALGIKTPILTTNGWKAMGDLVAGDIVFGLNGQQTKVLEAHEQYETDDVYKVTFNDGSEIIADGEHLWATSTRDKLHNFYMIEKGNAKNRGNYPKFNRDKIKEYKKELKEYQDEFPEYLIIDRLMEEINVPRKIVEKIKKQLVPKIIDGENKYKTKEVFEKLYLNQLKNETIFTKRYGIPLEIVTTKEILSETTENKEQYVVPYVQAPLDFSDVILTDKEINYFVENLNSFSRIPEKIMTAHKDSRLKVLEALFANHGSFVHDLWSTIVITNKELRFSLQEFLIQFGLKLSSTIITNGVTLTFYSVNNKKKFPEISLTDYDVRYITSVEKVERQLVRCITVDSEDHLFLAGRSLIPTHNTLSYLIPAIFNQSKVVISTATKQLSEQIVNQDIPFVQKAVKELVPGKVFSAELLKGRDNYFCLAKQADQSKLNQQASLFSMDDVSGGGVASGTAKKMAKEIQSLEDWADKTKTGDRSEAPAVSDQVWRQFSSTSGECPGRSVCSFAQQCFAERTREKARKADVVITNHAVVANDFKQEESVMLGERDVFIFDEMHELDSYLSSAWGTSLTGKMIRDAHKTFKSLPGMGEKDLEEVDKLARKFNGVCGTLPEGVLEGTPDLLGKFVSRLHAVCTKVGLKAANEARDASDSVKKVATVISKKANEITDSCELILDDSPNTVRWVKGDEKEDKYTIYAAPLRVGPQLQSSLEQREAIMIGTSATIRVNGDFGIPVHNLALASSTTEFDTVALSTPFNYRKQGLMYIPDPDKFPAPVGADRKDHTEAVKKETADLVKAAGGRALCLFTTQWAATENGKFLRKKFPKMNILVQGEAPNPQLIEEFARDETSVLVATMGMWHGLDVPGPALSLVVMDKVPFKPMNDPLSTARQRWAEESGRNGFMDVYVADANVMLAQGAGRLIRASSDKGVIAILDTRLASKAYGRSMLKSLPDMLIYQDKKTIVDALARLAKTLDEK